MNNKIANLTRTKEIINQYDFGFQKRFGQNFLIDTHILDKIISGAEVTKDDIVIEVGPGIGSLTQYIAEYAKKVIAIEIDKKLIPILNETLKDYDNIEIVNQDILKVDLCKLVDSVESDRPVKVIANLPYYITTPIIMGIFESGANVSSITVMVQKEVADRMKAVPGNKDYGSLSLAVNFYSNPNIITQVSPNSFIPKPKVGSTVIQLVKKTESDINVSDSQLMFKIIRAAFNQRRKTLLNSLFNQANLELPKETIIKAIVDVGFNEKIRGEALSLHDFASLTNEIAKIINK